MLSSIQSPYNLLSASIKESFAAIDRFEWQVCEDLKSMRDNKFFTEGGYKNFEEYCNAELQQWGGYRRVNQLIGASAVVAALKGTEFDGVVTRESHARPLLRLVKSPEKLKQAVAIACEETPAPIAATFKKAVSIVAPPKEQKPKSQEQLFLKPGTKVKIIGQSHPDFGLEGVMASQLEKGLYTIDLEDGRRVKAYEGEIKAIAVSTVRTPQERTYTEEELQEQINRAIAEREVGLKTEAEGKALQSLRDDLKAVQDRANTKAKEVVKLQQRVDELEALRVLEVENQQLRDRVVELEEAIAAKSKNWGNTFNQQATKVLNAEVVKMVENLEPELHLRCLAVSPPQENQSAVVKLLGLSLEATSRSMPEMAVQLRKAAALILGVDEESLSREAERIRKGDGEQGRRGEGEKGRRGENNSTQCPMPNAQCSMPEDVLSAIRAVLTPDCTWDEFWAAAEPFQESKEGWWRSLLPNERELIKKLKKENDFSKEHGIYQGLWVSHSDLYKEAYNYKGVIESIDPDKEQITVRWRDTGDRVLSKEKYDYSPSELRVIDTPEEFVEF